jgi:hypothetical protein
VQHLSGAADGDAARACVHAQPVAAAPIGWRPAIDAHTASGADHVCSTSCAYTPPSASPSASPSTSPTARTAFAPRACALRHSTRLSGVYGAATSRGAARAHAQVRGASGARAPAATPAHVPPRCAYARASGRRIRRLRVPSPSDPSQYDRRDAQPHGPPGPGVHGGHASRQAPVQYIHRVPAR